MKVINYQDISFEDKNKTTENSVDDIVKEIIENVRKEGDKALREYSKKFDNADLKELKVTVKEIEDAFEEVDDSLLSAYKDAAINIRDFHQKQKEDSWSYEKEGILLGQRITPIQEVGMYVPGGQAAYPSTVLMDAIPAKVAGVERLVMVSPPNSEGKIHPNILAAAKIAGVDEIYKVGGAQAIAALAYGTESIKPVNKIVGPGNIFVATAKKEVFGKVGIDMIAGPSEVLIIADETANPEYIAADLLAQAEHDQLATSTLITIDKELAQKVQNAVDEQIKNTIARKEIAKTSIDNNGVIYLVNDLDEAFEIANKIAPEHLELLLKDSFDNINKVQNAGAIFIGEYSPEPLGDYFAGPNHTLPTSGTAKFSSPLGVYDFQKRSSLIHYDRSALEKEKDKIINFAESEGLDAHANSIKQRFKK